MSLIDTIKQRHSIRVYHPNPLSNETIEKIQDKMKNIHPLFNANLRFVLLHRPDLNGIKLGTYGVISGASTFLVGCYQESPNAKMALGYAMEEIVLSCTALGLGTCILGGTYRKGYFAKVVGLRENEKIGLISPIGYPSSSLTLMARIMGSTQEVKSRKPFANIVFESDYKTPIKQDHPYRLPLEMWRLAPSALNAQPWCALIDHNKVHFYITTMNHGYALYDIGIALSHFYLTCQENNIHGQLIQLNDTEYPQYPKLHYVISFVEDRK